MAVKKVVKKEVEKTPVVKTDVVYQVVFNGRVTREYTGENAESNAKSFAAKTGASFRKA